MNELLRLLATYVLLPDGGGFRLETSSVIVTLNPCEHGAVAVVKDAHTSEVECYHISIERL